MEEKGQKKESISLRKQKETEILTFDEVDNTEDESRNEEKEICESNRYREAVNKSLTRAEFLAFGQEEKTENVETGRDGEDLKENKE